MTSPVDQEELALFRDSVIKALEILGKNFGRVAFGINADEQNFWQVVR